MLARTATQLDIQALCKVHNVTDAYEMHIPYGPKRFGWSIEQNKVVVGLDQGKVVGFLVMDGKLETCPRVEMVYVLPVKRRKGIGRAMLEVALGILREVGAPKLVAWCDADKVGGSAFFMGMGFSGGETLKRSNGRVERKWTLRLTTPPE